MRVGTCGGLQADHDDGRPRDRALCDRRPTRRPPTTCSASRTPRPRTSGSSTRPCTRQSTSASRSASARSSRATSSTTPTPASAGRWSERGILAVEMEAAVLFTLGALRKIQAGCMLIVSDVIVEGEFVRISDEEMRKAVDEMTELALAHRDRVGNGDVPTRWPRHRLPRQPGRRPTGRPDGAGRRSRTGPQARGPRGRRADQRAPRASGRARPARRRSVAPALLVVVGGDGSVQRGRERPRRARRDAPSSR